MSESAPVGVVGLGAMGGRIAAALGAVRPVVVYDVRPDVVASAAESPGVTGAEALSELAGRVGTVVLSLPSAAVVGDVVDALVAATAGEEGPAALRRVADTSTIGPDESRAFAERLATVGIAYVDAPILGRPASVGSWTVPVGGPDDVVAAVADLLAPVARRVTGVGPVGSAATIKVLNNTMLGVINAATAEVLALAAAAGLDPGVFVDTVLESGAASVSGLFKDVAPRAVDGDFAPVFALELMLKDSHLGVELAARHGATLPVAEAAERFHAEAVSAGHGAEDSIAAVRLLEERFGVSARRR